MTYIGVKIIGDKYEKYIKATEYRSWLRDRCVRFETLNDNEVDKIPYAFVIYSAEDATAFKLRYGL
jgi:hypothetical protein